MKSYVVFIWVYGAIDFKFVGGEEELTLGDLMYIRDVCQDFIDAKKSQKENK